MNSKQIMILLLVSFVADPGLLPAIASAATTNPTSNTANAEPLYKNPLHQAVVERNVKKVRDALAAGANVEQLERGLSPLMIAAQTGTVDVIQILLQNHADLDRRSSDDTKIWRGSTALVYAAAAGQEEVVKLLLSNHAKPDIANDAGITACFAAATAGSRGIAKIILEREKGTDFRSKDIARILQAYVVTGDAVSAEELLRDGASPNTEGAPLSLLQIAASAGDARMAKLLVEYNASINYRSTDGTTPLMAAVMGGNEEIVSLFIAHGADLLATSSDGKTAKDLAVEMNESKLVKLLSRDHPPK